MRRLVPCPRCKRHVRVTETSCPHCGQSNGALTFAAVAIGAGLALAGCERPPAAVYGPAPVDPTVRVPPSEPTATSSATETPTATATATATASTTASTPKPPPDPGRLNVPAYGPPPRAPSTRVPNK